jgi:hypothetical protein
MPDIVVCLEICKIKGGVCLTSGVTHQPVCREHT